MIGSLLILLILLLNPFDLWMPTSLHMLLIALLSAAFLAFSNLLWREEAHDEREEWHRFFAGRLGYFFGTMILVIGIVVESLAHSLDTWLIIALAGMLVGKVIGRIYAGLYH